MLNRRQLLAGTTALVALSALALRAADVPAVDIFIPANPGGGWDQTGRLMERVMLSQGLISGATVTNVGGAGGTVGLDAGANLGPAVAGELAAFRAGGGAYVPVYGRRFLLVDPRAEPLLQLAREAAAAGVTAGRFIEIAVAVEQALARLGRRAMPLNIDGATAAI